MLIYLGVTAVPRATAQAVQRTSTESAHGSMRTEIHALLEATWFSEQGQLETKPLVAPWRRADEAWRTGKRKQWLRDGDIFGAYLHFLFREVKPPLPAGKRRHLREVLGAPQTDQLEDRFVRFAESVPRRYAIEFPIRAAVPFGAKEVKLSKELTLVTTEAEPQESGPLGSLFSGGLLGAIAPAAKTSQTFLRVQAIGFFDDSSGDSAANVALARLRQFLALSIAAGAMSSDYLSDANPSSDATVKDLTDADHLGDKFPIPPAIARMLKRWVISEVAFGTSLRRATAGEGGALARTLAQVPVPEAERADTIRKNLKSVVGVMGAKEADGENLRAAAEWYFDSLAEENETAALLYASIGLEAALDSPDNATTARLSDRLAWLLGHTRTERNALTTEYQSFYKVRSGLVHGRERSLDDDGRRQLRWGQATLLRVIDRDLEQWPLTTPTRTQNKAKAAVRARKPSKKRPVHV